MVRLDSGDTPPAARTDMAFFRNTGKAARKLNERKKQMKTDTACRYRGTEGGRACQLATGGIYLPLPRHRELYCDSADFANCPHYKADSRSETQKTETAAPAADSGRRRFTRTHRQALLFLAGCDEDGQMVTILENGARLVDLSRGGMRIESRRALPADSLVAFTFGADFAKPGLSGLGRVCWLSPPSEQGVHQAGLAFLQEKTCEVMATLLPC
ncbi:MAG: hypothetical protein A2521_01130 [Deltaproteobacteria bacterium RIFOXYD12_FULL_57_12]|nr:MAG: hypothetical protein A2521_01130 [Deltaproteobacteria bacterium RIFOXYD12_FULL_57_12]